MVGRYFSFLQPNFGCYFYFDLLLDDWSQKTDIWTELSLAIYILGLCAVSWPISRLKGHQSDETYFFILFNWVRWIVSC